MRQPGVLRTGPDGFANEGLIPAPLRTPCGKHHRCIGPYDYPPRLLHIAGMASPWRQHVANREEMPFRRSHAAVIEAAGRSGCPFANPPRIISSVSDRLPRTTRECFALQTSSLPSGAPEALDVRFGPRLFAVMRQVLRSLSDVAPRSAWRIANEGGLNLSSVRGALRRLAVAGLARQVEHDRFVRCGPAGPVLADEEVPPEVGRQILSCLTEPRRPREIAAIVNRPASVTTGHLRHLLKRGLVVRIAKGVYALTCRVHPSAADAQSPVMRVIIPAGCASANARRPALVEVTVMVPAGRQDDIYRHAETLREQPGDGLPGSAVQTLSKMDVAAPKTDSAAGHVGVGC